MSFQLNINRNNSPSFTTSHSNVGNKTSSVATTLRTRYNHIYHQTIKALSEAGFTQEERREFTTDLMKSYKHVYKAATEATEKLTKIKKQSKFIDIDLPRSLISDNVLTFDNPDPEDFKIMAKEHNYYKASLLARSLINGKESTESQWLTQSNPAEWISKEQYALAFWPIYTKLVNQLTQKKINLRFLTNVGTAQNILKIPPVGSSTHNRGNKRQKGRNRNRQGRGQGRRQGRGQGRRNGSRTIAALGSAFRGRGGKKDQGGGRRDDSRDERYRNSRGRDDRRGRNTRDKRDTRDKRNKRDTRNTRNKRNKRNAESKFDIQTASKILKENRDLVTDIAISDWDKIKILILQRFKAVYNEADVENNFSNIEFFQSVPDTYEKIADLEKHEKKGKLKAILIEEVSKATKNMIEITEADYKFDSGKHNLKFVKGFFIDIYNNTKIPLNNVIDTHKPLHSELKRLTTEIYKPININLVKYGDGQTKLTDKILKEMRDRIITGLLAYYKVAKSESLALLRKFSETFDIELDLDAPNTFNAPTNNAPTNNVQTNNAYRGKAPPRNIPNQNNSPSQPQVNEETQDRLDRIKALMAKYPNGTDKRIKLDKMYKNIVNKLNDSVET